MPDIGFLELLLVGAIAFLVLGPERMPELFAQVGRLVRKGRSWITDVKQQIDVETAPLKDPLTRVGEDLESGIEDYNSTIMKELGETLEPEDAGPAAQASRTERDKQQDG